MTSRIVLVAALACAANVRAQLDGHDIMGIPAYVDQDVPTGAEEGTKNGLWNGGLAEPSTEGIVAGPRVNGGFAVPSAAIPEVAHTNADCVGRMEGGRCVRFQNPTRVANEEDNMVSPEQGAPAAFEADIHLFVKKHFGQEVMVETSEDDHHASEGVTPKVANKVMNGVGNVASNAAAAALVPIGEDMMTAGDAEMNAIMNEGMINPPPPSTMKETVEAIRSSSSDESEATNGPGGIANGGEVYREGVLEVSLDDSSLITRIQYYSPQEARGDTASVEKNFAKMQTLGASLSRDYSNWVTGGDASAFEGLLAPVVKVVVPGPTVFKTSQEGDMSNGIIPLAMLRAQFIVDMAKERLLRVQMKPLGITGSKALFSCDRVNTDGAVYQKGYVRVTFNENGKVETWANFDDETHADGETSPMWNKGIALARKMGPAFTQALTGGETDAFNSLFSATAWTLAYPGGTSYKVSAEGNLAAGVVTNTMIRSQLTMERSRVGYVRTEAKCVGALEKSVLVAYKEFRSDDAAVPVPVDIRTAGGKVDESGEVEKEFEVPLEVEDEEDKIPATIIPDPEPTLPPTPSALPTPDPAEVESKRLAIEAKEQQMEHCIAFLAENQVQCSGATPADTHDMATPEAPAGAEPDEKTGGPLDKATSQDAAFDPANQRGNFQQLILHCTSEANAEFNAAETPTSDLRVAYSAKLSKYASAMLCLENDFPDCMPTKAAEIIKNPPHMIMEDGFKREKWPCW